MCIRDRLASVGEEVVHRTGASGGRERPAVGPSGLGPTDTAVRTSGLGVTFQVKHLVDDVFVDELELDVLDVQVMAHPVEEFIDL